ncbi:Eco57I restriction-modification methylase domain-containing protein [Aerococcaceae bacterium NML180378]|nr:Eco57I restriction-modification methylase domain-containing protein [Aerococcaceae bacterium NML180378]
MSTKYFDYLPTYQQELEHHLSVDNLEEKFTYCRKLIETNPRGAGLEARVLLEMSINNIAMKSAGMRKKELGVLAKTIDKLRKQRIISDNQAEIFTEIRKIGNDAAHGAEVSIQKAEKAFVLWDNALRTILREQGKRVSLPDKIKDTMMITTYTTFDRKLIYIQGANTESGGYDAYIGLEKIGDASVPNDWEADFQPNSDYLRTYAKKRINQYMTTAGVPYVLHWAQLAVNKKGFFRDYDVHQVLKKSGYNPVSLGRDDNGRALEWFKVSVDIAKKAIAAVKEGRSSLSPQDLKIKSEPIQFRPEQRNAIDQTVKVFKKNKEMLWNAKMRFGKTLTSLQVMKECEYKKVLIITHRPVVSDGWFEDFHKIFADGQMLFGSRVKGESINNLVRQDKGFVYFASIQDLRESTWAGGKYDKNHEVAETEWDCIIIDEAHEGNGTELAQQMKQCLIHEETRVLELSGTPFNLMDKYDEENIFTWDYTMEQSAKEQWDLEHPNEPNPYESLPKVLMYTFDVSKQFNFIDEQKSFNFKEFFRVEVDNPLRFVHQTEVERFLNYITTNDKENNFPFSTKEFRQNLRHTLWILPGIKEANALEELLKNHPVFEESYTIVNVVKDDTDEKQSSNEDALQLVRKAIGTDPSQTKTITLTVRKLTTGVNVPEWTGVMFLSNTESPTTYLQAAFRAQTPFNHEKLGIKKQCYVFDFAPDRALKIMSESVGLTSKKGKINTTEQKEKLGRLLNFLPVLGQAGHAMKPFNVDTMLTQIKKVYAEKAVKTGFEDTSLYNDHLLSLTQVELEQFADLKQIVGKSANKRKEHVVVNQQGLDKEEYDKALEVEKKPKEQRTEEEKVLIEQAKKAREQRRTMISILRGVSIRIPMLIYGMDVDIDEDITLDKFIELVDEASWEEFMPKGLTKGKFRTFTKYYDAEVFIEAGRIIRRKAKSYDKLDFIERTEKIAQLFATFKNPDKETVLTPWRVVNRQIVSTIGGYSFYDEQFENDTIDGRSASRWVEREDTAAIYHPQTRILDINAKTGLYPLFIATSLYYKGMQEESERNAGKFDPITTWQRILKENVYACAKTPMAKRITERTLTGYQTYETNVQYIDNLVPLMKKDTNQAAETIKEAFNHVKFDVIIGNPPYQESTIGDNTTFAPPIYHKFMESSYELADKVVLITPARFLFNAGSTPKDWNQKMLNDTHIRVEFFEVDSSVVFPNTDIKGGVTITYRDIYQDFGKIGTFTPYIELHGTMKKVESLNENTLNTVITGRGVYKLSKEALETYPEIEEIQSKGHKYDVGSGAFKILSDILFFETRQSEHDVQVLGLLEGKRTYRWINRKYLDVPTSFNKYKVIIPQSNGSGVIGEVQSAPLIGEPLIGATDTFLSVGEFDTYFEAESMLKYIKTKFCRALLGILKITQANTRDKWAKVPLQDFTSNSDIDWTQSIAEIDQQLYRKYKLSPEEIAFIEEKVKAMD